MTAGMSKPKKRAITATATSRSRMVNPARTLTHPLFGGRGIVTLYLETSAELKASNAE
jgi:hypothetical protein